jgi:hypothetical protein
MGSHQAVDLDLDGTPEVIASASASRATDGRRLWGWGALRSENMWKLKGIFGTTETALLPVGSWFGDSWTDVGDIDGDGLPEVVLTPYEAVGLVNTTETEAFWVFENDGSFKAMYPIFQASSATDWILGPPTIANLDGVGAPEVIIAANQVATRDASAIAIVVSAYHGDGSLYWRRTMAPGVEIVNGAPPISAFDFDGDGAYELVVEDTQRVSILNGRDGSTRFELAVNAATRAPAGYVTIADVDRDGVAELVVPMKSAAGASAHLRSGIMVIGDVRGNWRGARPVWNQALYQTTAIADDAQVPAHPAPHWSHGHGNYVQGVLPVSVRRVHSCRLRGTTPCRSAPA